jgi:hypothetical protein
VILYAALQALRKVIFGFTWQERAIIFGEKPEDAQRFIDNCKTLYTDYSAMWTELSKGIKKRLPGIAVNVTPEYTLPGGRCLSPDTCINCKIDGHFDVKTIAELWLIIGYKTIEVASMVRGKLGYTKASTIWRSGKKTTIVLSANGNTLRVSPEHLVFVPDAYDYWPAYALRKGTSVLVSNGKELSVARLAFDPLPYAIEEVYDIEVPSSGNLVTNNIVTHNSRWFRYMYKGSS